MRDSHLGAVVNAAAAVVLAVLWIGSVPAPALGAVTVGDGEALLVCWPSDNDLSAASSYRVFGLPNETNAIQATLSHQYAGYVPVVGDEVSSLLGSFIENGPVAIKDNGSLGANLHSWHKLANIVYLEQPVGTGFSFTATPAGNARSENQVGNDFYTFLDGFFTIFPNLKKNKLFITGESYAGTYIPYISAILLNRGTLSDGTLINLSGIAIGNGLIDPAQQNALGGATLVNNIDFYHETGFFGDDAEALAGLDAIGSRCADAKSYTTACDTFAYVADYYAKKEAATPGACLSVYNIKQDCRYDNAKEQNLISYLSNSTVRSALHVDSVEIAALGRPEPWVNCSNPVYLDLYTGDSALPPSDTLIPRLIAAGIPTLLYNGDLDVILNYVGFERTIGNMTWGGATGFQAPLTEWMLDGAPAGLMAEERGLTYVRIFNAGHMVPHNQPIAAYKLISALLAKNSTWEGKSFPLPGYMAPANATAPSVTFAQTSTIPPLPVTAAVAVAIATTTASTSAAFDGNSVQFAVATSADTQEQLQEHIKQNCLRRE
ncbi:Cell death protease [Irineochytrium annulatum]|nr:Cell death protease [Irineochytrium annulatum]